MKKLIIKIISTVLITLIAIIGHSPIQANATNPICFSDCNVTYNFNYGVIDVNITGVSATSGINRVSVAVWSDFNGQDDLIWYNARKSYKEGTYTLSVEKSNHKNNNGKYNVHIYIYDNEGHQYGIAKSVTIDPNKPIIDSYSITESKLDGNVKITLNNLRDSENGYNDYWKYNRIKSINIAIWTDKNGQDDIKWVTPTSTGNGNYEFSFNRSSHNNEYGLYHIHIYAYNTSGKFIGIPEKINLLNYDSSNNNINISNLNMSITSKDVNLREPYYCCFTDESTVSYNGSKLSTRDISEAEYNIVNTYVSDIKFLSEDDKKTLRELCQQNQLTRYKETSILDLDDIKAIKAFFIKAKFYGASIADIKGIIQGDPTKNSIQINVHGTNYSLKSLYESLKTTLCQEKDTRNNTNRNETIYTNNIARSLSDACFIGDNLGFLEFFDGDYACEDALLRFISPEFSTNRIPDNLLDGTTSNEIPTLNKLNTSYRDWYMKKHNELKTNYYTDISDNSLFCIDLTRMINDTTSTRNKYNYNVSNFLKLIKSNYSTIYNNCTNIKSLNLKSSEFEVSNFPEYTHASGKVLMDDLLSSNKCKYVDWYTAVDYSKGGIKASVTRNSNNSLHVKLDYYLDDYYDYNIFNTQTIGGTIDKPINLGFGIKITENITQKDMAILHMCGYAKEYEMIGKCTQEFDISSNLTDSQIETLVSTRQL